MPQVVVGLDPHLKQTQETVMTMDGKIVKQERFKNKIRAELAKGWIEIGNPWSKRRKRQLGELRIMGIGHCLPVINVFDERIAELSKDIERRAEGSEDAEIGSGTHGKSTSTSSKTSRTRKLPWKLATATNRCTGCSKTWGSR